MRKDEYIASAVSRIKNKKAKWETACELAEHIDELTEFYLNRSSSKEEAEERAVADMGGPELIADKMRELHKEGISRTILALTIVGIVKTVLALICYKGYYSGGFLNYFACALIMFEVVSDGLTLFFAQPILVLIFTINTCKNRIKEETIKILDYILSVICVGIWVAAAILWNETCLLGF